jgi:hypothetical protein
VRLIFAGQAKVSWKTGLAGQAKVTRKNLIAVRLSGKPLRLLGPALESALALELRLLAKFDLALALLEGLTGFSDDCTSTLI